MDKLRRSRNWGLLEAPTGGFLTVAEYLWL